MKKKDLYIAVLLALWVGLFLIAKVAFLGYNREVESLGVVPALGVLGHGLLLDLRVAALLTLPVALAIATMRRRARWFCLPYLAVASFFVALIVAADMVMYEFWEFKLCAVHLSYAASPEGTTNSVSPWFLATRVMMILAFWLPTLAVSMRIIPREPSRRSGVVGLVLCLALGLLPVDVGSAYYRAPLFHCHAATNPVFRFAQSFFDDSRFVRLDVDKLAGRDRWALPEGIDADAEEEGLASTWEPMEEYRTGDAVTDTLLCTQRPNILLILMESFGGKFVRELGGLPDVAPQLSRLIPEGIFWENYYSNSFRTNRGIVSACSGWISYPTLSLMEHPNLHASLPSLANSLQREGYRTGYLYGGSMSNMGKARYVGNMLFEAIMDELYFDASELTGSWGADDGTAARRLYETIADIDGGPQWMLVWQTLSSHEPWDVPYQRLEDAKLNAFAYTDDCIGRLVDSLRTLPLWDNLLVIIIPDHGYLYEQTYDTGDFFHGPMLWTGGAVRRPRRMQVLMNQSDIAATLLAQMGLGHADYPWSRNVLAPDYRPFVYCNYPAGLYFRDATGETLYDLSANRPLPVGVQPDFTRLRRALNILKASYKRAAHL